MLPQQYRVECNVTVIILLSRNNYCYILKFCVKTLDDHADHFKNLRNKVNLGSHTYVWRLKKRPTTSMAKREDKKYVDIMSNI